MCSTTKEKEAVCVTGANGFIGSWIVKTLVDSGYETIHASIFPGSNSSHLLSLHPSIKIFEANVIDYNSISRAIDDCRGVFHVASPCSLEDPTDPEEELIKPAVQGTLNVLKAAKEAGVRRVVLTSSISSMVPNPGWPNSVPFDESSWTDLDYCKSRQVIEGGREMVSCVKDTTLAEKAAWEFSEKNELDVVVINPATCLGRLLQPGLNASCAVLQQMLQGSHDSQEYHWLGVVHVKDVARAQVLLFENPAASGRHLCTNGIYQFGDFAAKVHELFPEYPVHRFSGETQPGMMSCKDASKKLIYMGLVFTPLEETVRETIESLKANGFLN